MTDIELLDITVPGWLLLVCVVLVATIVLLFVKHFLISYLVRFTDRSSYFLDTLVLRSVRFPSTLLVISFSLFLLEKLLNTTSESSGLVTKVVYYLLPVLLIIASVIFVDRLIAGAISHYSHGSKVLHSSQSIIKGIIRSVIYGLGILVLLGSLGISITPIIASLGIGSLAVALALQPTLGNFFSGVQLLMDRPIRVGDYIELESGEQGFVEKIGWRSTWIKMLPNNTVIMPNSSLSESKIINYFYPQKELSVPVEVSVHYSSDLDHVERVTLEVAREILRTHEYGVSDYDTFVLFHTFDSSSINLTVMLRAHEYFQRFFIKSAFIKALHKKYQEEGIVIPYPIRAINTEQESRDK